MSPLPDRILTINLRADSPSYEQFRYPMGESQVRLTPATAALVRETGLVVVRAAVCCAEDILRLALLRNAITGVAPLAATRLVMDYLPYSRADRRFTTGDCCGLETFGDLIRAMGWDEVITLDVHNLDNARRYLPQLRNVSPQPLITLAIADFARWQSADRMTILYPDKGARDRYAGMMPAVIHTPERQIAIAIEHAEKVRDPLTGALSHFEVPPLADGQYPVMVVDDLCDGGRTFLGIGGQLRYPGKSGLYVTHGVFSQGTRALLHTFDRIYTSDSIAHAAAPDGVESGNLVVFNARLADI